MNSAYRNIKRIAIRTFGTIVCLILFSYTFGSSRNKNEGDPQKRYTILGLGDSITEGGTNFQSYLFPLWEKLFTKGYFFEFIGPNSSQCRIGTLNCAGFSEKSSEFLDTHIDSIYRKYPADIVLLHSGHNHHDSEKPIAGIVAANKSIIRKIREINPNVKILVAQVITSGKLPKYSYIPTLNRHIAKMVKQLNSNNVLLVNQAKRFNWQKYTVNDKEHPNAAGAEKIASVWFNAMKKIMTPPKEAFKPLIISYKKLDSDDLKLHVFKPNGIKKGEKRPAIIYFFGGGWSVGTPLQFYRECVYYAEKGMIAITAEYRISYIHKTTPFESIEDAKDAIRWLRKNADQLDIDPDRIAAAGASAGGHLAAATGILKGTRARKTDVNFKPNLLLLYYPVIDNSANGYGTEEMKKKYMEISPLHNIDSTAPPTLFILGTKDPLIPINIAEEFKKKMESLGGYCELHLYEGAGHPIFFYSKPLTDDFYNIRKESDAFLLKHGFLKNQ
ncbi:MAG: alpha/beta hydrolase fold domain-containing protein [Bacteroidetes bacterium]|nr:alpha/beta hydrolase fold domain-containing protein [Bacteroidota bacterium]